MSVNFAGMKNSDWNFFEERIATLVLIQKLKLNDAIANLCKGFPGRDPNGLLLAAISFVTHFDEHSLFFEDRVIEEIVGGYRIVAVLAADLALVRTKDCTCEKLQEFWVATGSRVFLPRR